MRSTIAIPPKKNDKTDVSLTWLTPRLELGANTVLEFIVLTIEAIRSYKADKIKC